MIRTTFDESFDWAGAVPDGCAVAVVGCADCASACGTGDTKRIEAVAKLLNGRCRLLFTGSLEAPCDGRAFRLFAKTVEGFDRLDRLVLLACEAGARSVADHAKRSGLPLRVVCPLETRGFIWISSDGSSHAIPPAPDAPPEGGGTGA